MSNQLDSEERQQKRLTALCRDILTTKNTMLPIQTSFSVNGWLAYLRVQERIAYETKDFVGPARQGVADYA